MAGDSTRQRAGIGARRDDLGRARFDLGAHEIEEVEANLILLARKGLSPLHKITQGSTSTFLLDSGSKGYGLADLIDCRRCHFVLSTSCTVLPLLARCMYDSYYWKMSGICNQNAAFIR